MIVIKRTIAFEKASVKDEFTVLLPRHQRQTRRGLKGFAFNFGQAAEFNAKTYSQFVWYLLVSFAVLFSKSPINTKLRHLEITEF